MKIFLDYDDTLVDLIHPTLSWIDVQLGGAERVCALSEVATYDFLAGRYGMWIKEYWRKPHTYFTDIFPLDGAVEFVEMLKYRFGEENIFIVTRADERIQEEKAEHVEHHFDISPDRVLFPWDKYKVTKGGVLIDDFHENIHGHIINNLMPGILFNYENRHPWVTMEVQSQCVHQISSYYNILKTLETIDGDFTRIAERGC